ncbi:MAG: hypothetical protein M1836_006560 [Candelina mexicana]|nr:MAG: hypothetical protein M1836_006560 [Candelina mexicana]
MIGETTGEYIFIRACISFLHYIAPLSILYTFVVLSFRPSSYRVPWALEIWVLAETGFFFLVYLPRRYHLQHAATHPPNLSPEDRSILFNLCHDNVSDPESYLSKWFLGAPASEIKRENVKEFFRWAFLNTGEFDPADDAEIEDYIIRMEKLLGRKFEAGKGNAKPLRLSLDKVDMLHRSLTWYMCVCVVDTIAYCRMVYYSFHFHRVSRFRFFKVFPFRPLTLLSRHRSPAKRLTYWHHPHVSKNKIPVLFVHGIGIGLYPYVNFLADLNEKVVRDCLDDDVGIIAIEIMPISFRITHAAVEKDEMCQEIRQVLAKHGWDRFVLVSHSYGSIVSTHLLKTPYMAEMIGAVLLIDPVSFLLHLPDVAYNFTKRKPSRANEYQLYYFGSMDMGVSHTLSRCFFWSENILWKHDVEGRKLTAILSGKDLIVNTEAVGRYLTREDGMKAINGSAHDDGWKHRAWKGTGMDVLWFEDLDHAQVFDSKKNRKRMVNIVRAYCAQK